MQLLSADWLTEAQRSLVGLSVFSGQDSSIESGTVQYSISGSPTKLLSFCIGVVDGEITTFELGKSADSAVKVSLDYGDACAILEGELTCDTGYMSGAIKVEGNYRWWLLDLRPLHAKALAALKPLNTQGHETSIS